MSVSSGLIKTVLYGTSKMKRRGGQKKKCIEVLKSGPGSARMDGRMTCDFTSFTTVFQSFQDDGSLIMKSCVK